jgi:hypothetical protein
MKIKTSELEGSALNWAVAKCEGYFDIGMAVIVDGEVQVHYFVRWNPAADWAQAGPIIELAFISIFDLPSGIDVAQHPTFTKEDLWEAEICPTGEDSIRYCGPTPLIAAMRCYVASKLGDEVDVPDL